MIWKGLWFCWGLSCSLQKADFSTLKRIALGHQHPSPDTTPKGNTLDEPHCRGTLPLKWGSFGAAQAKHPALPGKRLFSLLAAYLPTFSLCDSESQEAGSGLGTYFPEACIPLLWHYWGNWGSCLPLLLQSLQVWSHHLIPQHTLKHHQWSQEGGYFLPSCTPALREVMSSPKHCSWLKPSSLTAHSNVPKYKAGKLSLWSPGQLYLVPLHQLFITKSFQSS